MDCSQVNASHFRERSPHRNVWGEARRQIHHRGKTTQYRPDHGRVEDRSTAKTKNINPLEYLATKSGTEIVTIISDDQKVFFDSLKNNDVLKSSDKLKTLIQIIYNLTNASMESEHLNTLLCQITLEKYEKFYSHLREFIKKLPSRQLVDENVLILKQVTHVFQKLISTIPKQCEMLPLDDLQEVTKLLQQQEKGSRYDEYAVCAKSLVELFKESEAMEVDGDLYDYQTIPVLPEAHEINRHTKPKLQANIIDGSYKDWDHYLHVQFSLLREDYISPLRQGICDYNRGMKEKSKENISVYKSVRILEPIFLHSGVGFCIRFDVAESHLRHVQWEHSTRLIYGSLLCLSRSEFASVLFATVIDRDPESLRDGILKVQFENSKILQVLQINPRHEFTMVESTAYFEAYRHVLNRLKNIIKDPPSYNAYIIDCDPQLSIPLPLYLRTQIEQSITFDLTGLEDINSKSKSDKLMSVNILDLNAWPHYNDIGLDKLQLAAIQMALTQELSLIQGPPGTGKTYIGIRIVDILLKNKALIQNAPILVVCYTNHALDQFLEGILKFTRDGDNPIRMVRIGGRCSSKDIEPYTLTEQLQQHKKAKHYSLLRKNVRNAIQLMDQQHESIKKNVPNFNLHIQVKILELSDLSTVINYDHSKQLQKFCPSDNKNNEIKYWLFSATHKRKPEKKERYDKVHAPKPEEATIADVDTEASLLENNRMTGELIELELLAGKDEQTAMDWDSNDSKYNSHHSYEKAQIKEGLKHKPMTEGEVHDVKSITKLSYQQRWSLYQYWTSRYMQKCKQRVADYVEAYSHACEKYHEAQNILNCAVLGGAHIVGMTTTGAAKYHNILQKIKPKIIIIEEAAEVLESHIVTTLSSSTQQLIMIGDHQQLRPKPSDYHLATNHNLEVSLFERLVKNGLQFVTLEVQHRMRPEIAELICPHIYTTLRNAPRVCDYRDVIGTKHNVYFISHTNPEDDYRDDSLSHSNNFEAEFCIKLCKYFLKCGYRRNQITILTMYSGQLLKMKKLMPRGIFEGIKVTSVDNFQGEENDIIILSLVRSNDKKTVGFLKESNRVCVALSRAKMGLFVIGNFSLIKEAGGKVWKAIIGDMEEKELVGTGLPLYCSTHNITTIITSIDDFVKVPEGGCNKICGIELPCGHFCPRVCHRIMDHSTYKCKEKCHKVLSCSHLCQSDCYECTHGCRPCPELVKRKLPCGHTCEVECHAQLDSCRCHEHVERTLPCGHINILECWIQLDLYKCREHVERTLLCGHIGVVECCVELDKYRCHEYVERTLPCGHIIVTECYVKLDLIKCHKPCTKILSCRHKCKKECHMECTRECQEPVTKMLLCGHFTYNLLCSRPISEIKCKVKCMERLSCGHPCSGNCHSCYIGRLHRPCGRFQPCDHIYNFICFNHGMHEYPVPVYIINAVFLVRSSVRDKNWHDCIEKYVDMIEKKIVKHNKGSRPKLSLTPHQINAIYFQAKNLPMVFKLLDFTYEVYKIFEFANVEVHTKTIKNYIINLCDFIINIQYLTEQAKIDSKSEFNRLFMLIQLCQLCDIMSITCVVTKDDYKSISDIAFQLLNAGTCSSNKVTDECVADIFCKFKDFEKKYEIGDITKQEKLLDIKMTDLCKFHRYKCSNGHYFCINEHESDTQTVKCHECIDLEIRFTVTSINQHVSAIDD